LPNRSFAEQDNALHYQKSLQAKTNYTVQIVKRKSHDKYFNAIIIGPMSSPAEVRKTAIALLSPSQAKGHLERPDTLLPTQVQDNLMWSSPIGESWYL